MKEKNLLEIIWKAIIFQPDLLGNKIEGMELSSIFSLGLMKILTNIIKKCKSLHKDFHSSQDIIEKLLHLLFPFQKGIERSEIEALFKENNVRKSAINLLKVLSLNFQDNVKFVIEYLKPFYK
jgi:hypothetical protein